MNFKFLSDLQAAPDDPIFSVTGNEIHASFIPDQAESDQGGAIAGASVPVTSGGITINLLFDTAAMSAPANFRSGIQQAVSILAATITDKITVNIHIDYSGVGGGAAAGPDSGFFES